MSSRIEPDVLESRRPRQRVLVIAPHGSYRTTPFLDAAKRLDTEILFASEGKHSVISTYADGLHLDLQNSEQCLDRLLLEAQRRPFAGVVGTDDATTEVAALVAQKLGLPCNPSAAVKIARRKDLARTCLARKNVPVPKHQVIDLRLALPEQAQYVDFPCVLKPLTLSASRGVIRADNLGEFLKACVRIGQLLRSENVTEQNHILMEEFIPGAEISVEGMLIRGKLNILAIFDKPDPLDGPFFEETYYITPSRLSRTIQLRIQEQVQQACDAYGLKEGPIHGECRLNDDGIWILEVAARTIGGLCARLLNFGTGYSLEELVLAHAMDISLTQPKQRRGAGVLMIPTPEAGILRRVEGIPAAQKVPFVRDVEILVREGYELVPWPEGSSYLGFIFADAPTPQQAETALRRAHANLKFIVAPIWSLKQVAM